MYRARAGFDKTAVTYRSSGDYHRVDRDTSESAYDLSWELSDDLQLFGGFTRLSQNGYWLTNRLGNQNLTSLTTVSGVESPRSLDSDLSEIGLSGSVYAVHYSVALEYRDDGLDSRWAN